MNFKKLSVFILLILFLGCGMVSASEIADSQNQTLIDESPLSDNDLPQEDLLESTSSEELSQNSDEIVVENWDELQYYCSLKDKDYTLKLKENTNYYPTKPSDANYQIKVYNNVKIIGSKGSYIGDKSPNPSTIGYTAIVVLDNYKSSIYLENVTFKWISASNSPDGLFLQMGGKYESVIKNCNFTDIKVSHGHATIVYLKKGTARLENCSFINCTSGYGVVSVYDPNNVKNVKMTVTDCYFEGNYATTAPGCINNCGILEVYNSTFYKNRAFWWAGAIHTHSSGNTTIYDSNFTDNVAGWNGGALYTYSYLQIYNTIFSGNNCTTNNGGGAIGACTYQSNPHIYIKDSLFENNANNCWALDSLSTTGTGRGGAISLMDEGSLEIRDTTFIANSASIGSAICAIAVKEYGSPDVFIINNSFINHTRVGDPLIVTVSGTTAVIENNYFYGNSIPFSNLELKAIVVDKDYATLQITNAIKNPSYYDQDILDKTEYDVFVNDEYVKTVGSTVFDLDFDDLDVCDVYVIPTISNQKSNSVHLVSTREYIFVSNVRGSDENDGLSRDTPVNSIKKALELAEDCQSILILDGFYDEDELTFDYDLLIKGEGNTTLTKTTHFIANCNQFTLKNIKIADLTIPLFIKQDNGNLTVENCIFNNNNESILMDAGSVEISKSIITNNGVVVKNNDFASIKNSVLLNNTKVIDNNLDSVVLDYNWWGNTLDNISKPSDLNINNWLVLNITSTCDALEKDQSSKIQFNMYLFENNQLIRYNDLKKFNLDVLSENGNVNKNVISYDSLIVYTQTGVSDGFLTVKYNDIVISKDFQFLKSNPKLAISFSDIMYNDDLIITVSAPSDASGDISVSVGGETTVKPISNGLKFTFKYLTANNYDITVNYDGDGKYLSQTINSNVAVSKYESSTSVSVGAVNVGEDILITVTTSRGTAGTVNLYINDDINEVLTLTNCKATCTFKSVGRGDYLIKAHYNGNDRFKESESVFYLEVDNQEPNIDVLIDDTKYGEMAVVNINLNDVDAEGYVTVSVGGITNSSQVINGESKVYINGVDAGLNNVSVFYSGDNNYFNKTINVSMQVFKNNFAFNISSEDIYIGHDAVITIIVPPKTSGNFTIGDVVLSIPLSGEVSYVIPDLCVGNYTITAVYNGNNYFTVENSTSFTVFEYPYAQWSNDGVDTENTQKTEYTGVSNGELYWSNQINSTILTNIVIDSAGNLYIATTEGIYSYDSNGNLRWIYHSDARIGNFSGLTIGRDVIISPRAGDTIYLIRNTLNLVNQTTGEKYGDSNIYQASSIFAPVIDSNANIYTVSEYQFEAQGYNLVITPFKIWESGGSPVLISLSNYKPIAAPSFNDDVGAVLCEGILMIVDANNLKVINGKTGNFKNVRPVIGDGNMIYTIVGDSLYALYSSGASLWNTEITGGSGDRLLLDNDLGVIYATNSKGNLYKYDVIDHEETLITDLSISSGILIDADHNLYFGCDNLFYCMDSNGKILWKTDLSSKITGNPVMNKDGVIYVTTSDNKLFALGNSTEKPATENTSSSDKPSGNVPVSDKDSFKSDSSKQTGTVKNTAKKASKITAKKKTFKKSLKTKKYTVTLKSGKSPIKKVTVTIKIGKKTFKAKTNAKGKATFKIKKLTKKGKYTAVIKFSGNKSYKATTKKVKIVLK